MGKEWDTLGTGRKGNPFDPKGTNFAKGGFKSGNGYSNRETPAYGRNRMPKCAKCGKWEYNASKSSQCQCPEPDFVLDTWTYPRKMQAWHEAWAREALRVLKPGGNLLAAGGTRTYHRLVCAIEDAGFQVVDTVMHLHGQGFPKGRSLLKPAWEPWTLARKKGKGWLGVDACRIESGGDHMRSYQPTNGTRNVFGQQSGFMPTNAPGRWPSNLVLSHTPDCREVGVKRVSSNGRKNKQGEMEPGYMRGWEGEDRAWGDVGTETVPAWECAEGCPVAELDRQSGVTKSVCAAQGSAARFFYVAKASRRDRGESNTHPTCKPTALMEYLVKLVSPPGGTVLDPFLGSGTTGVAALRGGFSFVGIEQSAEYCEIARRRIAEAAGETLPLFAGVGVL